MPRIWDDGLMKAVNDRKTKSDRDKRERAARDKLLGILPWAKPFRKQCRAELSLDGDEYWGRCELAPHGKDIEHAVERGMIWIRWHDGPVRVEQPKYGGAQ